MHVLLASIHKTIIFIVSLFTEFHMSTFWYIALIRFIDHMYAHVHKAKLTSCMNIFVINTANS